MRTELVDKLCLEGVLEPKAAPYRKHYGKRGNDGEDCTIGKRTRFGLYVAVEEGANRQVEYFDAFDYRCGPHICPYAIAAIAVEAPGFDIQSHGSPPYMMDYLHILLYHYSTYKGITNS